MSGRWPFLIENILNQIISICKMEKEAKINEPEPVEYQFIERECTDEEMEYIDLLLNILRSGDDQAVNALTLEMYQISSSLHKQG